ncbi:MAG: class I SAM-dependent methyltransferase [Myxococcota bacterium]
MNGNIPVELGPVQETLLVPLLGRAEETRRASGLLNDPKAVEIVGELDYDFSKWEGMTTLKGATLRTRMMDNFVRRFLAQNPLGTVVEIGAGLNTRYERLDNGKAQWVELDLADSMALRRRFFEDTPRRTMVTGSVVDTDWHDHVSQRPSPFCFVSEAVIIYLDEEKATRALSCIASRFGGSTLVMDTTSGRMVERQSQHEIMKMMSKDSWFRWKCDDPGSLSRYGLHLEESMTFVDAPRDVLAHAPWMWRTMSTYLPWFTRWMIGGYRLNRFTLGDPN